MTLRVSTARFGELVIDDDKVIDMPDGMVGFASRRFTILNPDNDGPFCWLQATDNPELAFVVVDPTVFVPDYRVKLTCDEYDKLHLEQDDEVVLLAVVTMARDPQQMTVNLQGPIVLNPVRMTARQIVLEGNQETRHRLFPEQVPVREPRTETASLPLAVSRFASLYSDLNLACACP